MASPNPPPPDYPIDVPGIGDHPEIAVGPAGIGLVSYYDDVNRDLKVAYLEGGAELNIGDASVVEGNGGSTTAVFEVRLSSPADATVFFTTQVGTASSGSDYVSTSGTLTFSSGITSRSVAVGVVGDLAIEGLEFFNVHLSRTSRARSSRTSRTSASYHDDDIATLAVTGSLDHGASVVADLAADPGPAPAIDLFRIAQAPFASYRGRGRRDRGGREPAGPEARRP